MAMILARTGHTGFAGTLEEAAAEVLPLGGAALQQRTPLLARPRRGGGARATERKEQAAAIACCSRLSLSLVRRRSKGCSDRARETECEQRSEELGKTGRRVEQGRGRGKIPDEVWVGRDAHRRATMRRKQEDAGRHLCSQDGDRRKRRARRRNSRPRPRLRPDGMD
uniref:Uncharacterized protein n=1 Tax=Oryza punctata TaxID=4537 RepID=A0A0E0JZ66_ORYPU